MESSRVVAEDVVAAVVADDALEALGEIVRVDRGKAAGLVGQDAEAVLRRLQLALQRHHPEVERRVVGDRRDLRGIVEGAQAARIDPVEADVGARGGGDGVLAVLPDVGGVGVGDRIVNVVVDPFAEEHDRFAAAADARHVVGDVLEDGIRVPGLVDPDLLVRIARPAARAGTERPVVLVNPAEGRRALFLAHEVVDGAEQPFPAAGEFLARRLGAAGLDDRRDVVGPQVALDELFGGELHARRPREAGVEIVEHQDEHPAVEFLAVAADIGLDRLGLIERRIEFLDRDVDERDDRDRLRLAAFQNLEVVLGQAADEVALLVGDAGVDLDVVDLDLEGNRRLVAGGRGRWILLRSQFPHGNARRKSDEEDEQRQAERMGAHKVSNVQNRRGQASSL